MMARDSAFFELELGSGDPNELTPPMGDTETGLRIAAPSTVSTAENTIPVTAIARFTSEGRDALPPRLWQSLVVVVWDSTKNVLYAATLGDPSPIPEAEGDDAEEAPPGEEDAGSAPVNVPKPPVAPAASDEPEDEPLFDGPDEPLPASGPPIPLTGGYFTQYRTFDLLEAIDLPPGPARYLVFATYGPHHSNTVRIAIVDPAARQPGGVR